jgi:starvation-inducible DNA-binding protein
MNGLTSNYNNYSAVELEKALQSWVEPYPKPIIMNHDLNTEPIGRVMAAKMDKEGDGSPFVRLQVAITDPVAAQKILDKRYLTGSVGGRAGKAVCSISGEDLATENASGRPAAPKYRRGQVYKGKLAFIDMQDISFKEYSFVNQPADGKSGVRSTTVVDDENKKPTSEGWVAKSSAFVLHMNEEDIYSFDEHESLLKNMKKKESKPLYLHLKGAFLTAMAIQESESAHSEANSLLSSEEVEKDINSQENSNMGKVTNSEDILAAVEGLSEDLSAIASNIGEQADPEDAPEVEETPEAPAAEEAPVAAAAEEAPEAAQESAKVEEADPSGTAAVLQKVLNNTLVFYFAAHRAHWNVEGDDFAEFHELFASIYEDAIGSVDRLAENIRKVQAYPANLTEVVMNADFKDDSSYRDAIELSQMLLEKNVTLNESILSAFTVANEANEQGVANFLAERDDMTKKWSWQLRSVLKMEVGEPADESWRIKKSEEVSESVEELVVVDSANPEASKENQEEEAAKAELTGNESASEENADASKLQSLEEENQKLKNALHRTLVERVVDAKIAAGVESHEVRESLIQEHVSRSASSLADSLRDLAKMPATKKIAGMMLEMNSEIEVIEGEENVTTINGEEEVVEEKVTNTPEQLFVDALMGRRKL